MGVKAEGMLRVCQGESSNFLTSASLRYPLSVFNKKLYSQRSIGGPPGPSIGGWRPTETGAADSWYMELRECDLCDSARSVETSA